MKTVLITGAAGFIGSHLAEKCLKQGYSVIGVDDLSSGRQENIREIVNDKRFYFLKQDLTKKRTVSTIKKILETKKISKIETIVHLAAKKIPRYGGRLETLRVNIGSTISTCELAKLYQSKLIFASTSDVYGLSTKLPFREEDPITFGPSFVGRWSYGASKYLGEQYVFGYHEETKIPVCIARIFGVYGPRQVEGWKGNAVSAFFEQARRSKIYELHGDGQQRRTFVYISDLINGLMKLLGDTSPGNCIINLGSTERITMATLARTIHRLVHPRAPFRHKRVSYRSFTGEIYQDVKAKLPDLTQARKLLGWFPVVSLQEGLGRTWEWYQHQS